MVPESFAPCGACPFGVRQGLVRPPKLSPGLVVDWGQILGPVWRLVTANQGLRPWVRTAQANAGWMEKMAAWNDASPCLA